MRKFLLAFLFLITWASSMPATPITVSSIVIPNWQAGGSTAELRVYSDQSFYASDGTFVPATRVDSRTAYVTVTCTVSGTNVTCPQVVLQTTDDGTNRQDARYTVRLYTETGKSTELFLLINAVIRSTQAPSTTWTAIAAAESTATPTPTPSEAYTTSEADGIHATITTTANNAVTTANSAVTTANSAVSTANTASSNASTALSTANSAQTLANTNASKIVKTLAQDYSNNLAAALTAIGSTPTTLVINEPNIEYDANTTIPDTLTLRFEDGGSLLVASGRTVTVSSMEDPGNVQVFVDGGGTVNLAPRAVEHLNITWWGGTDTSKDQTEAFTSAIAGCAASGGGVIFIPEGVWLTDGGHVLPSHCTLEGQGRHGDSVYSTIIKINSGSAETFIFKASEAFRDITLRDLGLTTGTKTTVSAFIAEGTAPNSGNGLHFENVSFHGTGSGSPAQMWVKDLGSSWEILNVNFDKCLWITPANSRSFQSDTINTAFQFQQPSFLIGANSVGAYIASAANVHFSNPSFLGTNVFNTETLNRTVTGSITSGTNALTLNTGTLTQNDIGQRVVISGKLDSYITSITSTTTATTEDNATATASSGSLGIYRSTPPTTQAKAAIQITGPHGLITVVASQDEGLGYFLINDGSQQQYPLAIINSNLQSRIRLNATMTLTSIGNSYFSQGFEETAGDSRIISVGDYIHKRNLFYNSSGQGVLLTKPRVWGVKSGGGVFLTQFNSREGELNQAIGMPLEILHDYTNFAGNPQTTLPVLGIGTAFDKPALRIGRLDTVLDEFDYWYDFQRDATTGRLSITGNQSANAGLDFNGRLVKRTKTALTSSATVALDVSASDRFTLTPAHNMTINVSNGADGQQFTLEVTTSGITSFDIIFGTGFKSQGNLATGTTSGAVFKLLFECNGTNCVEVSRTSAM